MNHGNIKTDVRLTPQYGSGTLGQRQMNDGVEPAEQRRKIKDAQDRALTVEERGYALQMG